MPVVHISVGEQIGMHIELRGRPNVDRVVRRKNVVIIAMKQETHKALTLGDMQDQEGLEAPSYLVFIPEKQWHQIEKPLRHPRDTLIVRGYFAYDEELDQMVVYASHAHSQFLLRRAEEREQRAKGLAPPKKDDKGSQDSKGSKDSKSNRPDQASGRQADAGQAQAKPPVKQAPKQAPKGTQKAEPAKPSPAREPITDDVRRRLKDLQNARDTLKRKVEALGPDDKSAAVTQRLLAQTERQLEQFLARYPGLKDG